MVRVIIFSIIMTGITAAPATAQEDLFARARLHMQKGESCFDSGDMDCARREFDRAVDSVLEHGIDLRSDPALLRSWREMIERINAFQLDAFNGARASGWKMQDYEGRPAAEQARLEGEQEYEADGPLAPAEFQKRFATLRKLFREAHNRDIVLTGADHGEHRRLYGPGSAYDIRARDLTREQVAYLIETGRKLGLRIKDFSTWPKVTAHNARVISLGRPLDTLATGLHLHIDRMGTPRKSNLATKPVTKREAKSDPLRNKKQ